MPLVIQRHNIGRGRTYLVYTISQDRNTDWQVRHPAPLNYMEPTYCNEKPTMTPWNVTQLGNMCVYTILYKKYGNKNLVENMSLS